MGRRKISCHVGRCLPLTPASETPMKLKLKCPGCGATYRLTERPPVDHVRCPTCKTRFPVDPPPPAKAEDKPARRFALFDRRSRDAAGLISTWLLFAVAVGFLTAALLGLG